MENSIKIKGARVNNLKNIDLEIPRGKLVVITGLSGSGKRSLAFDTLYAEGQRRYVESLSSYARQFLGRMNKPECDYIKGIPPAIAIELTVGYVHKDEVYDGFDSFAHIATNPKIRARTLRKTCRKNPSGSV